MDQKRGSPLLQKPFSGSRRGVTGELALSPRRNKRARDSIQRAEIPRNIDEHLPSNTSQMSVRSRSTEQTQQIVSSKSNPYREPRQGSGQISCPSSHCPLSGTNSIQAHANNSSVSRPRTRGVMTTDTIRQDTAKFSEVSSNNPHGPNWSRNREDRITTHPRDGRASQLEKKD